MTDDPAIQLAIADARRRIAAHGWMIQGVHNLEDETGDWMFTVGLTEAGLPELVLSGIPRHVVAQGIAETVINHLARLSLSEELESGRLYGAGLDDGTEVTVVERELEKPLGLALAMYGRERVRYLVIEPVGENSA